MWRQRLVAAAAVAVLACVGGCGASGAPSVPGSSTSTAAPGPFCGGGGLTPCPASVLGGSVGSQPKAGVQGRFTEVALTPFFNADAVVPLDTRPRIVAPDPPPGVTGPGLYGVAFALSTFLRAGHWTVRLDDPGRTAVTFLIPAVGAGVPSVDLLTRQQTITVPSGRYQTLWLLEAGFGGYAGFDVDLHYSTGSDVTVPVAFSGWCRGVDDPPEYLAFLTTSHVGTTGQSVAGRCGLYAEGVALDPTRTLLSVTLPATASEVTADHSGVAGLMAMSLQS